MGRFTDDIPAPIFVPADVSDLRQHRIQFIHCRPNGVMHERIAVVANVVRRMDALRVAVRIRPAGARVHIVINIFGPTLPVEQLRDRPNVRLRDKQPQNKSHVGTVPKSLRAHLY